MQIWVILGVSGCCYSLKDPGNFIYLSFNKHFKYVGEEKRRVRERWEQEGNEKPGFLANCEDNIHQLPRHSGKMTCFKAAAAHQNRMNLRSPHQLLFVCYCRQPCPCKVAAGWRRPDRHGELARCRPLDTQSGAYITRWVNGSVRVGPDWCKRVCRQAAISCPQISCARL